MITPLKDNILIEVHKSEYTAMLQVDEREAQIEKATVLAVGKFVQFVKKGDIIYFKDYETDTIIDGDEKFVLINEDAIKGICTTATTKQSRTPKKVK